ncbi:hypothetical protein XA68_17984 [Ophiocordyceps unilateralis]|uniref:Uncharacterized protein n=1 Tax=Ophiocordyceps unilateralis TaxID=268505 RepID=A0A2A9P3M5_OPHUN|nr:hypothetical protein XA68_17984 [Ophiocordyceps unilateralis]
MQTSVFLADNEHRSPCPRPLAFCFSTMANKKKPAKGAARQLTPDNDGVDPASLRDDTPPKNRKGKTVQHRALAFRGQKETPLSAAKPPQKKPAKPTVATKAAKGTTKAAAEEQQPEAKKKQKKKKSSEAKPTIPAIGPKDKAALAKENRSLFLAMPRDVQPRNASQIAALNKLVATSNASKGLLKVIPSANSYLAVRYDTTESRDNAIKVLEKEKVTFKEKKLSPSVAEFGVRTSSDEPQAWLITAGPMDEAEDIESAVRAYLGENQLDNPGFSIRALLKNDVQQAIFVVLWDKSVLFTKHLKVKGAQRLVSCEPRGQCRLCGEQHRMRRCDRNAVLQLGVELLAVEEEAFTPPEEGDKMDLDPPAPENAEDAAQPETPDEPQPPGEQAPQGEPEAQEPLPPKPKVAPTPAPANKRPAEPAQSEQAQKGPAGPGPAQAATQGDTSSEDEGDDEEEEAPEPAPEPARRPAPAPSKSNEPSPRPPKRPKHSHRDERESSPRRESSRKGDKLRDRSRGKSRKST